MAAASDLLAVAALQIGTREDPPGSNRVRYNTWYYGREVSGKGYPWCMVFVQWCCAQAGIALPARTASCGALMRTAQSAGMWVSGELRPGDIVIYDFPGGADTDHCGIVESVTGSGVVAIEGNTGTASDSNGGEVMRRTRPYKQIVGAIRPAYEEETMTQEQFDKMLEDYLVRQRGQGASPWAAELIREAMALGLTDGARPREFCTRQEAIALALKAAKY